MKRFLRILTFLLIITGLSLGCAVLFSPFKKHEGDEFSSVKHTVIIKAPVASVYNYLGNSANASTWSVYVDHITTLNSNLIPDGHPGSIRRCFTSKEEKGPTWDELITIADPLKKRQLTIFNMQHFPIQSEGLASEQHYEVIDSTHTKLTFNFFYLHRKPGIIDLIKTHIASYRVQSIFEKNMEHIKREVEALSQL